MKISTKGRYALRLMLDLAEYQKDGYVSLKDVAERQGISKKYLEQIVLLLNKNKILKTNRGFQGGYMLAKSPDQYVVGDVLRITEGELLTMHCPDSGAIKCEKNDAKCKAYKVWIGLSKNICDYLDNITLQDVIDENVLPKK